MVRWKPGSGGVEVVMRVVMRVPMRVPGDRLAGRAGPDRASRGWMVASSLERGSIRSSI
jgi:hypothetical protein